MNKYLSDSNEINLRLPGPVPVPKEILDEQSKPLINHRGNDYKLLLDECTKNLKKIYATNMIYISLPVPEQVSWKHLYQIFYLKMMK